MKKDDDDDLMASVLLTAFFLTAHSLLIRLTCIPLIAFFSQLGQSKNMMSDFIKSARQVRGREGDVTGGGMRRQ